MVTQSAVHGGELRRGGSPKSRPGRPQRRNSNSGENKATICSLLTIPDNMAGCTQARHPHDVHGFRKLLDTHCRDVRRRPVYQNGSFIMSSPKGSLASL